MILYFTRFSLCFSFFQEAGKIPSPTTGARRTFLMEDFLSSNTIDELKGQAEIQ